MCVCVCVCVFLLFSLPPPPPSSLSASVIKITEDNRGLGREGGGAGVVVVWEVSYWFLTPSQPYGSYYGDGVGGG